MHAAPFTQTAAGRQGLRKRNILGVALSEMQTSKLRIKNFASEWIQCLLAHYEKKGVCVCVGGGVLECGTRTSPSSKAWHILCPSTIFHLVGLPFSQADLDLLLFVSVPVPGIAQVPGQNSSFPPIPGKRDHGACPYLVAAFTSRDWVGL